MNKPALSERIRVGLQRNALAIAKWAGYDAAQQNRTVPQHSRYGSNANSLASQQQRVQMQWDGEWLMKNTALGVNYATKRRIYCSTDVTYAPDTGDTKLDEELGAYLVEEFAQTGVNCSMMEAFSRTADVELPMRGDSALVWYRDMTRLKLMEVQADRIGELYTFVQPQSSIAGLTYFAGIFFDAAGTHQAFKIYERGFNDVYFNPQIYPASDVIYFQDNMMQAVRGVTKFAQALQIAEKRAQILKFTMDTMAQQSKIAAISSNNSGGPTEASYETINTLNGGVEYQETFADGAVLKYQFNGDQYQVLRAEHPSEAFIKAMDSLDMQSSLALGLPYEFLFTPSGSGGAPARFSFEAAGKEIMRIRNTIHRPRLNKISYVKIMEAVENGLFPAIPTITRGNWNWPTLPSADAFRDVISDIKEVRAGHTSLKRVITANTGASFETVLRENKATAIAIAKTVEDANKELTDGGYEPVITRDDIQEIWDNPQPVQSAPGDNQQSNDPETAAMSAYMGDTLLGELDEDTIVDVTRFSGATDKGVKIPKYGMTVPELLHKADTHNLNAARAHVGKQTCRDCSEQVHGNESKHILLMNDRIIDGHHFLAKAERGKVGKSLQVLDLTPLRLLSQI